MTRSFAGFEAVQRLILSGLNHHRKIALEPWPQEIVDRETEEFVLGLIHSDGCRVVANDRGVMSVRYHFSNGSEDIIGLFASALDRLAITWRRRTNTRCPSLEKRRPHAWTNSSDR